MSVNVTDAILFSQLIFRIQAALFFVFSLVGIAPGFLLRRFVGVNSNQRSEVTPWRAYGSVAFGVAAMSLLVSSNTDSEFLGMANKFGILQFFVVGAYWASLFRGTSLPLRVHIVHVLLFAVFCGLHGTAIVWFGAS